MSRNFIKMIWTPKCMIYIRMKNNMNRFKSRIKQTG